MIVKNINPKENTGQRKEPRMLSNFTIVKWFSTSKMQICTEIEKRKGEELADFQMIPRRLAGNFLNYTVAATGLPGHRKPPNVLSRGQCIKSEIGF